MSIILASRARGLATVLLGMVGRFARAVARSVGDGASRTRFAMYSASLAAKAGFEVDAWRTSCGDALSQLSGEMSRVDVCFAMDGVARFGPCYCSFDLQ